MHLGECLAQGFVFADQVRDGPQAKPNGLNPFGRAHQPATEWYDDHEHIQERMAGMRHTSTNSLTPAHVCHE